MNTREKVLLVIGFLVLGAVNTLTKKFQFDTCSFADADKYRITMSLVSCPPGERTFTKPWSQNLLMFIGESWVYLLFMYKRSVERKRLLQPDSESLDAPLTPSTSYDKKVPFYVFLFPASCDVLATGVGGIGMIYVSASVWQMMRGSLIVFSSILSVTVLGRKLYCYNWVAVCTSVFGLILVGYSAVLDSGADSANIVIGIWLTCLAQFFTAAQMICQELFVKSYNVKPEQCVGSEGIWGITIMIVVLSAMYMIPGQDHGSYENVIDSYQMLTNSGMLAGLVLMYLVSISIFNVLGVLMSGKLSTVHRTINDALRTAIVWGVQLSLFYMGSTTYGQGLTAHSWVQLLGFCFLVMGTLLQNMVIKLPCLYYPGQEDYRKLRPLGTTMSPTGQGVSVLSMIGSPLASPTQSPRTEHRVSIAAAPVYADPKHAKTVAENDEIVMVEE